jgi:hypothetical protein
MWLIGWLVETQCWQLHYDGTIRMACVHAGGGGGGHMHWVIT